LTSSTHISQYPQLAQQYLVAGIDLNEDGGFAPLSLLGG
jgi:hypothetical protein